MRSARSRATRILPLSRAPHRSPGLPRGGAEAEGGLLHPDRRLCRRRDEARADRAARRVDAGVCVATESPVLDKVLSNVEEVRARGASTIAIVTAGDDRAPRSPTRRSRSPAPIGSCSRSSRSCRCSCWPTTSPPPAASTSTSPATSRRPSPSSDRPSCSGNRCGRSSRRSRVRRGRGLRIGAAAGERGPAGLGRLRRRDHPADRRTEGEHRRDHREGDRQRRSRRVHRLQIRGKLGRGERPDRLRERSRALAGTRCRVLRRTL